jgi:hypothetical protein
VLLGPRDAGLYLFDRRFGSFDGFPAMTAMVARRALERGLCGLQIRERGLHLGLIGSCHSNDDPAGNRAQHRRNNQRGTLE